MGKVLDASKIFGMVGGDGESLMWAILEKSSGMTTHRDA